MDSTLLKWHMEQHGDTDKTLAKALGMHSHTLYMKRKGEKQQFTQSEIKTIAIRYNLTSEDINKIFFT